MLEAPFQVTLIGNYAPDAQPSMRRFAEMLQEGLASRGVPVELLRPQPIAGRYQTGHRTADKWIRYVDKYVLFPPQLRRRIRRPPATPVIVHVCDHSNAVYVPSDSLLPHVVTCHDLLAVRAARGEFAIAPTGWPGRQLQAAILRGLRRADRVVCDSHATRDDLWRIVPGVKTSVRVVHPAVSPAFSPQSSAERGERIRRLLETGSGPMPPIPGPTGFLLHVGGNQWYKNREGLIEIYAALASRMPEVPPLVLAGKAPASDLRALIATRGLAERVIALSDASDEDLAALYSAAAALVFPSHAEGFGWPVLEAMACGCRVVASDRPPLTEIGGDAVTYIDPGDPTRAAEVIAGVLHEPDERRRAHLARGVARAARFTSDSMIEAYLHVYRGVLRASAPEGRPAAPVAGERGSAPAATGQ